MELVKKMRKNEHAAQVVSSLQKKKQKSTKYYACINIAFIKAQLVYDKIN